MFIKQFHPPVMNPTNIRSRRPKGSPAWFNAYGKPGVKKAQLQLRGIGGNMGNIKKYKICINKKKREFETQ